RSPPRRGARRGADRRARGRRAASARRLGGEGDTAREEEGAGRVAHLDPAAPEMQHAALEVRREAKRPRVRRRVHADVAVLGDDRAPRKPPGAKPGGEAGRLRRALEQRGPGPGSGASAAAQRRAVPAVDRVHDQRAAAVAEELGGCGGAHASVRKRSVARAAHAPRRRTSASTRVAATRRALTTISSSGVTRVRKAHRSSAASTAVGATSAAASSAINPARWAPGTIGSPGKWPSQSRSACARRTTPRATPSPMVSAANAASSGTALLGRGERAAEPETRHVAPEVALQPAATQPGEEALLVVHLHAGQEPVAARAGRLAHPLGEALAHRGGEVE